jgi:hypothetical protein
MLSSDPVRQKMFIVTRTITMLALATLFVCLACGDAANTRHPAEVDRDVHQPAVDSLAVIKVTLERRFSGGYDTGSFHERITVVLVGDLEYEGSGDLPADGSVRQHQQGHSRSGRHRASSESAWIRSELERLEAFVLANLERLRSTPWAAGWEHEITDSVSIHLSSDEVISYDIQDMADGVDSTAWALVRLLRYIDSVADWKPS